MESHPLNIIVLGRSGSGKGTQVKLLVDAFNFEYIETGGLLRSFIARDGTFAKKIKNEMATGKLVPSWLASFVWMEKLIYINEKKSILFDGSPRKLKEADVLDSVLHWLGRVNVKVLLLDISKDQARNRILNRRICMDCNKNIYIKNNETVQQCTHCSGKLMRRLEDSPDAIEERMLWFEEEVMQVVERYRKKGNLVVVNGEQTVTQVSKEIIEKLNL